MADSLWELVEAVSLRGFQVWVDLVEPAWLLCQRLVVVVCLRVALPEVQAWLWGKVVVWFPHSVLRTCI